VYSVAAAGYGVIAAGMSFGHIQVHVSAACSCSLPTPVSATMLAVLSCMQG
jgi:hypothetical protein